MIDYGYNIQLHSIDSIPQELLREWRNDPETREMCREYRLISKSMQNHYINSLDHSKNLMFSIYVPKKELVHDGFYVGACGLTNISYVHGSGEFSIYIGKEFRRAGYATKALQTIISYGFKCCRLNRIWGETFACNPGIILYKKLGFTFEGTLRESYFKNGSFINSHIYSIVFSDWLKLKP